MDPQTEEKIKEEIESTPINPDAKKIPLGVLIIMITALVCLIVVGWFIIASWSQPSDDDGGQIVTDSVPVEEPEADSPIIRDPVILGLRNDTVIGQIFIYPETEQTLYVNPAGDCVGDCLEDWTPYLAEKPLGLRRSLGTVIRRDSGELQYSWEGQGLYLFNSDDSDGSLLGDGYAGTWRIARP